MKRVRRLVMALLVCGALVPVQVAAQEGNSDGFHPAGNGAPDFELAAVQLRIGLDRALAEHAFLSIEAMRTGIAGGPEFEVAAEVLEANTTEVVELVEAAYGADAADAFAEQWRNHIAYLVDYTRAVADGDEDARELASSQLEAYTADFSAFLAEANPSLPPDVVEGLIAEHVQQLQQIGSFAEAGFAQAYPAMRETYAHMFMVGDGVALGVLAQFGDRFPGQSTAFSPALDMRIGLDRLLGEHTYLAAIAMRARMSAGPDLDAAIGALDANSADLAAQISEIYGADAGAAFDDLWRSHTRFYLAYVDAVADDDAAAENEALEGLRSYESEFSAFLADANPYLQAAALERLLSAHTEHLVTQVTAYGDEDYRSSYDTLRSAYAHTEMLAAGLGGAIADQFPQVFPDTAMFESRTDWSLTSLGLVLLLCGAVLSGFRPGRGRADAARQPPAPGAVPRGTRPSAP